MNIVRALHNSIKYPFVHIDPIAFGSHRLNELTFKVLAYE